MDIVRTKGERSTGGTLMKRKFRAPVALNDTQNSIKLMSLILILTHNYKTVRQVRT